MKYRRLTRSEKSAIVEEQRSRWHKKFAWLPKRLTIDQHEVRWLEVIYRRGRMSRDYDSGRGYKWEWQYADNEFDIIKISWSEE